MPKARRSAPKYPVRWATLTVHGVTVKVVLSTPEASSCLAGCEGFCEYLTSTIYVLASLPDDRKEDVLWHELKHMMNYLSGFLETLKTRIRKELVFDEVEEEVVAVTAAAEVDTLRRNDMVRFPRIPASCRVKAA